MTNIEKFSSLNLISDVILGRGAFSTVFRCHSIANPNSPSCAVKCVKKERMSRNDHNQLVQEVSILQKIDHPRIVRLHSFFEEPSCFYLVMEEMHGGELFDRIITKETYSEGEARDFCKSLLEGVGFMHSRGVAHRDLKPENLLLANHEHHTDFKIADFGFAKDCTCKDGTSNILPMHTRCGTPGYVAPEILLHRPYTLSVDLWSVGVILYILLGGYPPFHENDQKDLFRKIRKGDFKFHDMYWHNISNDAKNLISSLLTVNPLERLDASSALTCRWIRSSPADTTDLYSKDLVEQLSRLKRFQAVSKIRRAVLLVSAVIKMTPTWNVKQMHDVAITGDENLVNTVLKSNHIRKQQSLALIPLESLSDKKSNKSC